MQIEIGKTYDVSAYYKKSLTEIEMFHNPKTDQRMNTEVCWRNGTFRVTIENEDEVGYLQACIGEDGDVWDYEDYETIELVDTFDGCSEDFVFYGKGWDDETKEALEEGYFDPDEEAEDYEEFFGAYDYLEIKGFESQDCNWQIHGGVTVEEVEDPATY